MSSFEKPLVFLDLETTGVSITHDRICQIALVKTFEKEIVDEKYLWIDPLVPIPAEATKVHGITKEKLIEEGANPFEHHANDIFQFLRGCDIGGHQMMIFDLPLLIEEFLRSGIKNFPHPETKYVDTYRLQEKLFPRTLEFCYEQLTGNKFDKGMAHNAVYDTLCTTDVYFKQLEKFPPETTSDFIFNLATRGFQVVDFSFKLKVDDKGLICYNFGKNQNKRVSSDLSYLNWMLTGDFTQDTKRWLNLCVKYHDSYTEILKSNSI